MADNMTRKEIKSITIDPWIYNAVVKIIEAQDRSFSAYVRIALIEKMRRDNKITEEKQ